MATKQDDALSFLDDFEAVVVRKDDVNLDEIFAEGQPIAFVLTVDSVAAKKAKPAPVVVKRKREGIQLCKVYEPDKPPKWPLVIFEPKLDGYRCIARIQNGNATLLTSTGIPHHNVKAIAAALEFAADESVFNNNFVLDGELIHRTLDFDTSGGILRTHAEDERAEGFVFHVWDILTTKEFDDKKCLNKLYARKKLLKKFMEMMPTGGNVEMIEYKEGNISQALEFAKEFILEDGCEGIILKSGDSLYEFKKSGVWLKWKPSIEGDTVKEMKEGDFRITDIKMGRGKHAGRLGAIFIEGYLLDDGNISPDPPAEGEAKKLAGKAGTGFDDAQRIQYLQWHNEGTLVGRTVEIRYQELSSKGKVRFPVFYRLRADKDYESQ